MKMFLAAIKRAPIVAVAVITVAVLLPGQVLAGPLRTIEGSTTAITGEPETYTCDTQNNYDQRIRWEGPGTNGDDTTSADDVPNNGQVSYDITFDATGEWTVTCEHYQPGVGPWLDQGALTVTVTSIYPEAPVISATAQTGTSVTLSWTAPNDNGSSIIRYDAQYREDGQSDDDWLDWVGSIVATATSVEITGLTNLTDYEFRVRAVNGNGDGAWSNVLDASTLAAPNAPEPATSSAQTGSSVTISWNEPNDNGSSLTGYKVQYRINGAGEWTDWPSTLPMNLRTLEVTELNNDTDYDFQVAAVNAIGIGPWSGTFTEATKAVPDQASGLILTSANTTQLSILWGAPDDNGHTINQYTLQYRANHTPKPTWTAQIVPPSPQPSVTIMNLTAGTAYEIRVRAENSEGNGGWSETLFAQTNADMFAADAPPNFMVEEMSSTNTLVVASLDWDEVTDAEGYQIERSVGGLVSYFTTTETHYEDSYTKTATASGNLVYRVRASKDVSGETRYTPWSSRSNILFYGTGTVAADSVLMEELAGQRTPEPGVMDARNSITGAIEDSTAATGFEVDTSGLMNLLAALPGLIILAGSAVAGVQFRQLGLALSVGWVIFVMSLFVAVAVVQFPIIWPILLVVFTILLGVVALARKVGWI